ncbi:hypothetical protein BRD17_09395, partial [Halobacteriales archaeon SW_7_68_16]
MGRRRRIVIELTSATDRASEPTLVTARLHNATDRHRRVRVAPTVDGPIRRPRVDRPGVRYDGDGIECDLAPGERVGIGLAVAGPVGDDPLSIVETTVVDGHASEIRATPADVARALGDPRPPRDAVPVPDGGAGTRRSNRREDRDGGEDGSGEGCRDG